MVTGLRFMIQKRISNIPDLKVKELSIQVGLNGLSFCTLDRYQNVLESFPFIPFENVFNSEQLLEEVSFHFKDWPVLHVPKKVKLIYINELSTFVPKSLFNEECLSDYLKYNVKILPNDFLTYDEIKNSELVNVYVPYININNFFIDLFGPFDYTHYSSILIETLLHSNHLKRDESTMYVHIHDNCFEIVVFKNTKLKFYNTFKYQTAEDFIYYILFTAEQLQMNPDAFNLQLIGNIKETDAAFQLAYQYIRNINILEFPIHYTSNNRELLFKHSNLVLENSF